MVNAYMKARRPPVGLIGQAKSSALSKMLPGVQALGAFGDKPVLVCRKGGGRNGHNQCTRGIAILRLGRVEGETNRNFCGRATSPALNTRLRVLCACAGALPLPLSPSGPPAWPSRFWDGCTREPTRSAPSPLSSTSSLLWEERLSPLKHCRTRTSMDNSV